MQVNNNNNNQTTFGMRRVMVIDGYASKKLEDRLISVKPEVREEIGHAASDCFIAKGRGIGRVLVRVVTKMGPDSHVATQAEGRVFTNRGLTKLIRKAADMVQINLPNDVSYELDYTTLENETNLLRWDAWKKFEKK